MLKQLMLNKRMETLRAEMATLEESYKDIEKREAEVEAAIDEAKTDEEIKVVEETIDGIEEEKKEYETKKSELEAKIQELEKEIDEIKSNEPAPKPIERKDDLTMIKRGFFNGMTRADVDNIIAREEVKEFTERTRQFITEKRSLKGGDLLIPDVLLGILRDNLALSSKLLTKVNYKPLKGKARQNVTGTIPEAVWTEMTGALNELDISFNQVEVDGYKVGGFVSIPNSIVQDSDINLVQEVMAQISKGIGIALDKAILYGTGTKQPLGIVTRIAQTTKPAGYPANAPEWTDIHATHNTKVSTTGAALVGSIIDAFGVCKNNYSDGRKFFAMNNYTYTYLVSTLLNFNAAGALATGMSNQMPILGGDIVILDFMSNGDIVGGYGDLYLLVEREGTVLAASEHAKFIEDQTVFKGLARYDGLPVIAEGFFVINVKNTDNATTKTFPLDLANPVLGELTIASAVGTNVDETDLTVTGNQESGTFLGYVVGDKAKNVKYGEYHTGYTPLTLTQGAATVEIGKANNNKIITIVEFYYGIAIAAGSVKLKVKAS